MKHYFLGQFIYIILFTICWNQFGIKKYVANISDSLCLKNVPPQTGEGTWEFIMGLKAANGLLSYDSPTIPSGVVRRKHILSG